MHEPAMRTLDDGTLDTVIRCQRCYKQYRYTFDSSVIEGSLSGGMSEYNDFVDWALEDAHELHLEDQDQ